MELRDVIVTPLVAMLILVIAYWIRPRLTDGVTRRYFLPALLCRLAGALALGFIYQFYYNGGDTFNFHTHGSRHIWEAFMESPELGVKLLLSNGKDYTGVYRYASKIPFYGDPSSYVVIRFAAVVDLLTFSSYSATALWFGFIGFLGSWMLFKTFYLRYERLHLPVAIATLFIPSVIFWGSGLLKDTLTLSALCSSTYALDQIFFQRKLTVLSSFLLLVSFYLIYYVKIYILLTFLPAVVLWVFLWNFYRIRLMALRVLVFPLVLAMILAFSYLAVMKAGEDNPRYNLNQLAETSRVTAYDIRYWTGRDAGSGYALGELDGSWQSMLRLTPQAINVSLFRPYLWEVNNPLMLLSALESLTLLLAALFIILRSPARFCSALARPDTAFCLVFAIVFAFAVGISTYNFGTLVRYKIPLMPFISLALVFAYDYSKSERKAREFEATE